MDDVINKEKKSAPFRPRFSWPMRIFLSALLFEIIFRSSVASGDYERWNEDVRVAAFPQPLPARSGRVESRSAAPPLGSFFDPRPSPESRACIDGPFDAGKYILCWMNSRLEFLENLVHAQQGWPMFAPDVGRADPVVRVRLLFDNGEMQVHRTLAEPDDLTHYSTARFLTRRETKYLSYLFGDEDARRGFCNVWSNRHRLSPQGARLIRIELLRIVCIYPKPGSDARQLLQGQQVPLGMEESQPFYAFDVLTQTGELLK